MKKNKKILYSILLAVIIILTSTVAFASNGGIGILSIISILFSLLFFSFPYIVLLIIISFISKARKAKNGNITNNLANNKTNVENNDNTNDESPVVAIDHNYIDTERNVVKNIIKQEIQNQNEDIKKFTTIKLNTKKNVLILILGLLILVDMIMWFFNESSFVIIGLAIFSILLYLFLNNRFNIVNVIYRKAKKNPDMDILDIVNEFKNNKKNIIIPNYLKLSIILVIVIVGPIIYFYNPKLLYKKYDNGYELYKCTKNIIDVNKEIIIPDTYEGEKVIAIGEGAFKNSNISRIKLPDTIESVKKDAFYNCKNINSITIPKGVKEIRASAFENCTNLMSISLPEGLTEIRANAFKNNESLSNIELPESLTYLGAGVFSECSSLKEITIPEKVIEINGNTFEYCTSLRKVNLHDNIISIHGETFVGDINLRKITLPSKITEIKGNTFEGCSSLTSIVIPEGVTRIGGHAFYGCSLLSSVTVPSTVAEIGSSAFRKCISLKTIKIPKKAVVNERAFKESPTKITYY